MKKSIFLFFAAILCAMTANAAYYYRGNQNSWGATEMTLSTDGMYSYFSAKSYKDNGNQNNNFKIAKTTEGWDYNADYLSSGFYGTNVTNMGKWDGDNCGIYHDKAYYVIVYHPNTLVNTTSKPKICASTTLPELEIYLKHPWNGGDWTYNKATNNGDGTYTYVNKYGNAGVNWCVFNNGSGETYVSNPTLEGNPVTGDMCNFVFNLANKTITITKQVTKNLGDITITMNCNQQPNIYFWDVEGKTCAEWPGEAMEAAGTNTYTYKFTNVDLDLGVNYKITLKKVNENEWATGDLHTTADVTHSVADLNIPQVAVMGVNNWDEGDKMTVSNDYLSASVTLTLNEIKKYDLKLKIGEDWKGHKDQNHITRAATSSVFKDNDDNGSVDVDYPGDYVFTYTYKTQTLEVTYPELPTPEYKDITIQVYAKQVPNIWWWNGGDQCADADDAYDWDTAPAMEAVVIDGNTWYQKTFKDVDVALGGIKFKLKSQDQSSGSNELQTTEDKCYDARVIATITETPCGQLPTGETPKVTYNVEVPAGTNTCYIAGEMNSWTLTEMTKVDDIHYTITIEGATTAHKYKYSSGPTWEWEEVISGDRTYSPNDVVTAWKAVYDPSAPVYDYYIAGTLAGGWSEKQQGMTKEGDVYKHTFTELNSGTYEFKITDGQFNSADDNTHEHTTLGAAYKEVSYSDDGNIKIITEEAINLTVIFDATADKITFDGLTEIPQGWYIISNSTNWEIITDGTQSLQPVAGESNSYKISLNLNAGTHELKVSNEKSETYGYSHITKKNYDELAEGKYNNIKITLSAPATIHLTFNSETKAITLSGDLTENITPLTYTVKVPAGTAKCYICGAWDWNTFMEMTPTANANEFTIDIVGATTGQEYKYTRGEGWEYAEVNNDGSTRANRTYNANDVVEKWADIISYVLMGVNGDWTDGIALTQNPNNSSEYMLLNQTITRATDAIKVVTLTNGEASAWCDNVEDVSDATYTKDDRSNIVLEDGIYDFYFKVNDNKIYIDQTAYVRNVTNTYGTICLPYASASTSGATFFEVVGQEAGNVYLASVTELEAGVPYIFEKSNSTTQIKVVYTGEKASTASSSNGLIGNFTNEKVVPTGNYILYSGAFIPADGTTNKVNAYRAYLDLSAVTGGAPQQMPGRRYIGMDVQGENIETGLDNNQLPISNIQKLIENGQLIIIRDGVKYNVQGQVIR